MGRQAYILLSRVGRHISSDDERIYSVLVNTCSDVNRFRRSRGLGRRPLLHTADGPSSSSFRPSLSVLFWFFVYSFDFGDDAGLANLACGSESGSDPCTGRVTSRASTPRNDTSAEVVIFMVPLGPTVATSFWWYCFSPHAVFLRPSRKTRRSGSEFLRV